MPPANILFVMTDQQRFDTIAALGNSPVLTPNLDRLVRRGIACTNAYSTCPVCVPSRYSLMSGCEPSRTSWFGNWSPGDRVRERCGPYLAETLAARGYRTWGIGKFHTEPRHEPLGFAMHEYSEELWPTEEEFLGDAVEELRRPDPSPQFGFVSFVTPHPPLAPPIPYNRLFDPDAMPDPVHGDPVIDAADDYLAWMNHAVWAEDIPPSHARRIRARYLGSIAFIDACLGRILDAVEARPDADNTLICFFSDHGDHLGDHRAWQKESFFEAACRVPMLVSWPAQLPAGVRHQSFTTLTDLFGLATAASGAAELRDGHDLYGALRGEAPAREAVIGMFGTPGTRQFKCMVRRGDWKYLWLANGGRELLFNLREDPAESRDFTAAAVDTAAALRAEAVRVLAARPLTAPAVEGTTLKALPFEPFPRMRIKQFARGVTDFGQGLPSGESPDDRVTSPAVLRQ